MKSYPKGHSNSTILPSPGKQHLSALLFIPPCYYLKVVFHNILWGTRLAEIKTQTQQHTKMHTAIGDGGRRIHTQAGPQSLCALSQPPLGKINE